MIQHVVALEKKKDLNSNRMWSPYTWTGACFKLNQKGVYLFFGREDPKPQLNASIYSMFCAVSDHTPPDWDNLFTPDKKPIDVDVTDNNKA